VLRSIATGKNAGIDRNHALPLLHEIRQDNLVFGVFPLVSSYFVPTWFVNITHALETMSQIMEGVAFLHDHLVAHRYLFRVIGNFLNSRRDGPWKPEHKSDFLRPRYYIIDFESAVQFSPDSDPVARTVSDPPLPWNRQPFPAEMKSDLPYCPFKTDVWQVGKSFLHLVHIEHEIPEIVKLLRQMCADNAEDRPSAREAVTELNRLRDELHTEILRASIKQPDYYDLTDEFDADYASSS
ncbi:hypothetical protein FB446DRAFT_646413, partial [Lentinula raphanica]